MRKLLLLILVASCFSCKKTTTINTAGPYCDIEKIRVQNRAKVTITQGIWGTLSRMTGNCMPVIGPKSTCRNCPVQRAIRVYEYTLRSQAVRTDTVDLFSSFSTRLIAEVNADADGFYQFELPAGHYTLAPIEEGRLYAGGFDGQGGLEPFTVSTGREELNPVIIRAVF